MGKPKMGDTKLIKTKILSAFLKAVTAKVLAKFPLIGTNLEV